MRSARISGCTRAAAKCCAPCRATTNRSTNAGCPIAIAIQHQGLYSDDRAKIPMIRKDGELVETDWDEAIAFAAERFEEGRRRSRRVGRSADVERGRLSCSAKSFARLAATHRSSPAHRSISPTARPAPTFEMPLAEIEKAERHPHRRIEPRHEQPLLSHRIRKAMEERRESLRDQSDRLRFQFPARRQTHRRRCGR